MFSFLCGKPEFDPAPNTFFSNYELLNKIGSGGYGTVYLCKSLSTGALHAVKIVHERRYRRCTWCARRGLDMPDEILLWEKTSHPSIVRLLDLYHEQEHWLAVMEYDAAYKDLYHTIAQCGTLSSTAARIVIRQVVQICTYLQSLGLDHRDIKDENILYNPATGHIKLIDFGSASLLSDTLYTHFQGTELFTPPEYYVKGCYQSRPAAVWSIGCLAYTLLKGTTPFIQTEEIVKGKMVAWDFTEDSRARDFIEKCLMYNVKHRAEFNQLAKHAWFKN